MSNESIIRKILLEDLGISRDSPEYMNQYMKIRQSVGKLSEEEIEKIEKDFKALKNRVLASIL